MSSLACPDQAEALWETEHNRHLVSRALAVMQSEFHLSTWQACWEFVFHERPAAEVARELGITENAVDIAKSRVLQRLRERLAELFD